MQARTLNAVDYVTVFVIASYHWIYITGSAIRNAIHALHYFSMQARTLNVLSRFGSEMKKSIDYL